MSVYLAEMIGTMILIILGDGVVANVVLKKSKGQDSGWMPPNKIGSASSTRKISGRIVDTSSIHARRGARLASILPL